MNAFCQLFIYKNCPILKNRNFKVDDIEDFLTTQESINKTSIGGNKLAITGQFMKHQLKLKYVIEFSQTTQDTNSKEISQRFLNYESFRNINYLKAVNVDTFRVTGGVIHRSPFKPVYYFITGKRWMSEGAVELELEMDVINTLIDNYYDEDEPHLSLSSKTLIYRQHKNRWGKVGADFYYKPLIDLYSENILSCLFKKDEAKIYETGIDHLGLPEALNENWYIIFRARNTNENAPIDVLICLDTGKTVQGGSTGYNGHKDPVADLPSRKRWVIYGADVGTGSINNVGASITFTDRHGTQTITIEHTNEAILISSGQIRFGTISNAGFTTIDAYYPRAFRRFRDVDFAGIYAVRISAEADFTDYTATYINNLDLADGFPSATSPVEIGSITDIDRTDEKLLKILKIPYCPLDILIKEDVLELPAGCGIQQGDANFPTLIKYTSTNTTDSFHSTLKLASTIRPYLAFKHKYMNYFGSKTYERNNELETKLLHSDFFQQKFVYDSFSYIFKGEFMDTSTDYEFYDQDGLWEIEFYVSATMNSKMFFNFPNEKLYATEYARHLITDVEDYSGILYVARSNELPIFNSAYLNYIRTGYNYDVKTKNRQLASNIVGGVLSTAGAVVSAVSSVATGPIGVAGAVGLGIGAVSKFSSAIFQTAQAEQNIAQKLKSTELQGLSVIGSDDVDLMSVYTDDNKAKMVVYEISEKMKKCVCDLFYYCGYIANIQDIPDTTSRLWFNFVQADPVFKYEQNFPQELIEELKKRYNEGITFLHAVPIYDADEDDYVKNWDFEQTKENWEVAEIRIPTITPIIAPTTYALKEVEYVIQGDLMATLTSQSSILASATDKKMIWRKRRKDTNEAIEEKEDMYGFGCTWDNWTPDVKKLRIYKWDGFEVVEEEVLLSDYLNANYYWTIEFVENSSDNSWGIANILQRLTQAVYYI